MLNLNSHGWMLSAHPKRRPVSDRKPQTAGAGEALDEAAKDSGDTKGTAFQEDDAARCLLIWPGEVPVHRLNAWLKAPSSE